MRWVRPLSLLLVLLLLLGMKQDPTNDEALNEERRIASDSAMETKL